MDDDLEEDEDEEERKEFSEWLDDDLDLPRHVRNAGVNSYLHQSARRHAVGNGGRSGHCAG